MHKFRNHPRFSRRIVLNCFFWSMLIGKSLLTSGCGVFSAPESQIETLDLAIPMMTLTAAAPTSPMTASPEPSLTPSRASDEVPILLIPMSADSDEEATLIPTSTPKSAAPESAASVYDLHGGMPTHPVFKLAEIPPLRSEEVTVTIVAGDTISAIANAYQVPVSAIVKRNDLSDPELIQVGQSLVIPAVEAETLPIGERIIADSDLVDGPSAFNAVEFLRSYPKNILTSYVESTPTPIPTPNGNTEPIPTLEFTPRSGIEVLEEVTLENAVNPKLLLALLEYQTQTITNEKPRLMLNESYIGALGWRTSLDHQLSWTANTLTYGYYQWKNNRLNAFTLSDDTVVAVDPSVNAGTAAVQYLFSKLYGREDWLFAISPNGFRATYDGFFGSESDKITELIDEPGGEPTLELPFAAEDEWFFSSGPHYGWANGSPWSAVDFVPGDSIGCSLSDMPVTAAALGLVIHSTDGLLIVDLDEDGDARTGWVHLYLHVASRDRAAVGTVVQTGDKLGYPSCEGGFSSGTHLHFARRYNGQWIPIDAAHPLVLSGYEVYSTGDVYDGYLVKDGVVVEAWYFQNDANRISR